MRAVPTSRPPIRGQCRQITARTNAAGRGASGICRALWDAHAQFFQALPPPAAAMPGVPDQPNQPVQQSAISTGGRAAPVPTPVSAPLFAPVSVPLDASTPQVTLSGTANATMQNAAPVHRALAQLDSVLDRLAAQFVPRLPVASHLGDAVQTVAQVHRMGPSMLADIPAALRDISTTSAGVPGRAMDGSSVMPMLRDVTWRAAVPPNLVLRSFDLATIAPSNPVGTPLPTQLPVQWPMPIALRGDMAIPAPIAPLADIGEGAQTNISQTSTAQATPLPPASAPITARDLSVLLAINAAMIPGFPNLMSQQTAAALRSRDVGQRLADLAHKLRNMDPAEQRIFLAGLHLPLRVLHDLQRQAKKWARFLGDRITADTIEGFLLLCLTVLGWPTTIAEYLWYCLTATDAPEDPDNSMPFNVWVP